MALIITFVVLPGREEGEVADPVDIEEGVGGDDVVDPVDLGEEEGSFLPSLRHFVIGGVEVRTA